jgi:hypothetical protein
VLSLPAGSAPPDDCGIWLARAVTLREAFQQTVARYPRQVALRPAGWAAITRRRYAARVRQIAAGLAGTPATVTVELIDFWAAADQLRRLG